MTHAHMLLMKTSRKRVMKIPFPRFLIPGTNKEIKSGFFFLVYYAFIKLTFK